MNSVQYMVLIQKYGLKEGVCGDSGREAVCRSRWSGYTPVQVYRWRAKAKELLPIV